MFSLWPKTVKCETSQVKSPDLNLTEHVFHLLSTRLMARRPPKQARNEYGCSTGLAEHHQGTRQVFVDVYAYQTVPEREGFGTKYLIYLLI